MSNEVELISIIRYQANMGYRIDCPEKKYFNRFEEAYNYLAMKGYHKVSSDENTDLKKSLEVDKDNYPVVMVMSKKVNKE